MYHETEGTASEKDPFEAKSPTKFHEYEILKTAGTQIYFSASYL